MKSGNTYKKLVKIMKKNQHSIVLSFIIMATLITILTIVPTAIAYADQEEQNTRSYKTIQIQPGDSLWSIAEENYTSECQSMSDYIYLIQKCNSLYDDKITAGCYLVVPYYE